MNKFAVFDIDGTLIRWQLYHALVDQLAKQGALGDNTHQLLHNARMRWKRREPGYGFSAYEIVLIEAYEAALTALSTQTFDELVDAVVEEYKDQVYAYTRELIKTLKQRGYFLIAISGSHQELVEKIAQHHGFDECVGSTYERTADAFSGKKTVASHHKKRILEHLIQKHSLTTKESYAVGDSKSDAPMLEMVEHAIAFNPDVELFDIAASHQWKVVVERKNMIYELEYRDAHYVLVQTGE